MKMNLESSELLLINEYSNKLREMCIKKVHYGKLKKSKF